MTPLEKEAALRLLERQRSGWAFLEEERKATIAKIVTKDVLPSLQSSFAYTLQLPARLESGFTLFYRALARGAKRC